MLVSDVIYNIIISCFAFNYAFDANVSIFLSFYKFKNIKYISKFLIFYFKYFSIYINYFTGKVFATRSSKRFFSISNIFLS